MYDLVYEFVMNTLLNSANFVHDSYYQELGLLLTHLSMWLIYVVLIMLLIHLFNSFRSMTRFW